MPELDLKTFERSIEVRPLKLEDYDHVVVLQLKCFPGMKPWTKEQYESQMEVFPAGQICVEYKGKIVASSSSLVLDFDVYSEHHGWREISDSGYIRNHTPDGNTLYGIEIMVDPEYRGMKLARRIYDARKKLSREMNLMRIVIGGRVPGYGEHAAKMSAREYVQKVIEKALIDPVLTTQLSNDFVLKRLLPDYLKSDTESRGYATLLEWTNLDYVPNPMESIVPVARVRICAVQYQMREVTSFAQFGQQVEYFLDVASDYKCDFILYPEMLTTQLLTLVKPDRPGLAMRKLSEFTPQYLDLFSNLAVKYNINIIGGTHVTVENKRLYNIAYLFRRDGTLGKQYKLHITKDERHWWGLQGGDSIEVFDTDRGKISIQVSHDITFPEISRIAAEKGAQIFFVPFSADDRPSYLRIRYCAQARAVENHAYVVIAGSVGNLPSVENLDIHYAQSGIYTPSDIPFERDAIAAECTPNTEMLVFEDIDLEQTKSHRKSGGLLDWKDRRHDLYELRYFRKDQAK
ncbi:MAG: GNAT family N-acetyltransferase [Proteobacteria bacterium]|nr:GNAT family N-acetyltransferase [Pseudomonadota bacterium]